MPLQVTGSHVNSARTGPVIVARIRGTPHFVAREARRITATDPGLLLVTLHSGAANAASEGRAAPGDLVVFDARRPYSLTVIDAGDVVALGLPRNMLGADADLIAGHATAPLRCDAGMRAVIAAFLYGLADHLDDLPGMPGIHLADALAALLVTAFAETTPRRTGVGSDLLDRILADVLANLGDPTLSVESVARRHGISSRYLHKLFRQRGITFAAWVRRERLTRIRRDLRDPAQASRTTAVIAARWGLPDSAHLSRALKKEFGLSAIEIRLTASRTDDQ